MHVVADVGDVHADLPYAVFHLLDGYGVVEVLSVARVDGECESVTEVLAFRYLLVGDLRRYLVGCRLHLSGVGVWQSVLSENGVHLCVVLSCLSENVNHLTLRVAYVHRPVSDAYCDFVIVLGFFPFVGRYGDVVQQACVRREQISLVVLHL